MSQPDTPTSDPSDQIDDAVRSIVEIHEDHLRKVGVVQRVANRTTDALARPATAVALTLIMMLWILWNVLAPLFGVAALDPWPAPELNLFGTVGAFIITLLILTTQRHEQGTDRRRDELTLHMAMLTEKKIAKVIALLEEQRRDNPQLGTRRDAEAETMAQPADPRISIERIDETSLTQRE